MFVVLCVLSWCSLFQLEVNPRYHPKIIGKKGNIIMKLRSDHDVQIELPKRGDENQSRIRIIGYEANVGKAKDALMKLVGRLVSPIFTLHM